MDDCLSTWWTGVPLIDTLARDGVCGGDVIELYGSSGVGKSELTLQLMFKCVLPLELGGSNCSVVVYDNDCKFDASRFIAVLLATLKSARTAFQIATTGRINDDNNNNDSDDQFDPLLKQCLQRVHVIRPRDVVDFVVSLRALPDFVSASLPTKCRLLIIDSISPWYWSMLNDANGSLYERDFTRFVRELADNHDIVVVACKQSLFNSHQAQLLQQHRAIAPPFVPLHREYLQRAWVQLVRIRVTLACDFIDAQDTTPEDGAEPQFVAYAVENLEWRGRRSAEPQRRQHAAFSISEAGLQFDKSINACTNPRPT
jgi:RecA/RadA recombinase